MHLANLVTIFLSVTVPACLCSPSQTSLSFPVHIASSTLVDVISADPDFSLFIRLLQRARLIPTLNKLQNATLFVPTNDAIRNGSDQNSRELLRFLNDEDEHKDTIGDNLRYRLRERLFYHMLNYSLALPLPNGCKDEHANDLHPLLSYETTLLFPTRHEEHGRPGHIPYPSSEDTLLGGEGQKLVLTTQQTKEESFIRVGVDEFGKGGANILPSKGGKAKNGIVVAINGVLNPPKSLAHLIRARRADKQQGLERFASLLSIDVWKWLQERAHLTLFAPLDEAFEALHPLEWKYLISGFATDDIVKIITNHQADLSYEATDKVGYLDRLVQRQTVPLLSGDSATVVLNDGQVKVNESIVMTSDILASNGVMHTIDSLLLPYESLALTPEKYLLALNATRFVALFRQADLSYLLNSSPYKYSNNASYTILATKDSVLERLSQLPWSALPPEGSKELKETLKYHIIQGKWTKADLTDGQLLRTMLRTSDLAGQQQPISVSVSSDNSKTVMQENEIAFGSANVIDEPIEVGNSIIYLISRVLEPPSTFVSTALDKGLSTFVAAVYASALDKQFLLHSPATTYLAPTNAAFDYLGLAMNYFLLPAARGELGQFLQYHAIPDTIYLGQLPYDSQHFTTIEGSDVFLERSTTHTHVRVRGPRVGGFPANGDNRPARVIEGDLLTSTGVLHVLNQVVLPPNINITGEKLMRGARASTFADLLSMVNMSWIAQGGPSPNSAETLNGEASMQQSKWSRKQIERRLFQQGSYTILCPTDKAFTKINLTHYLNDMTALLALVQLHIIPSPPPSKSSLKDPTKFPGDGRPLALADEATFSTLLSKSEGGTSEYGDLAFRQSGESDWLVGIKGARGTNGQHDAARILNFGRNTPQFSSETIVTLEAPNDAAEEVSRSSMVFGGGVLLIDGVLEPFEPTWLQRTGYIVIIVIICVAAVLLISLLVWKLWDRKKQQAVQYEGVRQENEED